MAIEGESLLAIGQGAQLEGRHSDAERAFRAVLADEPENVEALHLLGVNQLVTGQADTAIALIREAIDRAPERADFHCNLGVALKIAGRLQEAADALQDSIRLDERQHQAFQVLGDTLAAAGEPRRAALFYRKALERHPESVGVLLGLGRVLGELGELRDAEAFLARARAQQPDHPEVLFQHGLALYRLARLEEALPLFERLLDQPDYSHQATLSAATIEVERSRPSRGLAYIRELESRTAATAAILALKAAALNALGDRQEAIMAYREALALDPAHGLSWYELALMAPEVISDIDLQRMEKLQVDARKPLTKAQLCFGRARVFQYREELAAEFQALDQGNRLCRSVIPFNRERVRTENSSVRDLFTRDWFLAAREHGMAGVRPVFIVGMPRSGTTLVEQILSAHSAVEGVGENLAMISAMGEMGRHLGQDSVHDIFGSPDEETLVTFARLYLDYTRRVYGIGDTAFTDTSKASYRFLPLLAAAFPEARFISVQRDPLDLCFGCYRQFFSHGQAFSYDPADCAFQVGEFQRLIAHWESTLTEIPLYRLKYEALIAAQAEETGRLLEFCDLEWEEGCLDFQRNRRVVSTASQQQVRRGLGREGLHRGQHYGALLDPLREALRDQGLQWRE